MSNCVNINTVTRLEIIDYTSCKGCNLATRFACTICRGLGMPGRKVISNSIIETQLHNDNKTLKIFINENQ